MQHLTIYDVFSLERYAFNRFISESFFYSLSKKCPMKKIEFERQVINKIKVFHQKRLLTSLNL